MAVAVLLAACACCRPLLAQTTPATVHKITVRNNYLLTRAQVLSYLGVAEGVPLDEQALETAVTRWNDAATFGTISYRMEPAEGGAVELVLICSERLQLTRLTFRGNDHFSEKRLLKMIGLRPGETVTRFDAQAHEQEIAAAYRDAGYPLAQVRAQFSSVSPADRALTFYVSEGPRVWVERIVFEGNAQVEDDRLREVMRSKTRGLISWLRRGWFKEQVFREDVILVEVAYRAMGYLDAQAGGYVSYSEDMSRIALHVAVYEGELYRIRNVVFEGNTIFRDDELLEAVPLAAGEAFRPMDLETAIQRVSDLYANQGYMDVTAQKENLRAEPVFPLEGADVTVRFQITEGEPVFIRRIEIRGLSMTKESVVRRNLNFYPGERASKEKLRESERLLLNTGYFDFQSPRPVRITLEPDEGTLRDAIVQVEEGQTGRFMIGAGLGSESGVSGRISLVEENFDILNWPSSWNDLWRGNAFRGGGQRLSLVLSSGTERSYYSLGFFNPSVYDSDYSLGVNLYSMAVARNQFDETRTGVSVTTGRRLSKFVGRSITVGYENIDVDDVDSDAAAEIRREDGSHDKPFVRFRTYVDRRDSRFTPTEGYAASAEVEVAAGDVETVKLVLDGQKYWPVRERRDGARHVVGVRGRAGVIDSYGGRVPVFERFYAGGFSTLRGFEFEGVSPIDPATGDQVGGEALLVGSAEYSVPISPEARLWWVTFLDAGYVSEDKEDILTGWDELRLSVGTGLRWQVPALGPAFIEIDLAFPIMKESGDDTQNFHFSIGASRRF